MTALLSLSGHALAALFFAVLALWAWRRDRPPLPRTRFVAALGLTALWALSVACMGEGERGPVVVAVLRDLAWLFLLLRMHRDIGGGRGSFALGSVHAMVMGVIVVAGLSSLSTIPAAQSIGILLRLLALMGALLLVQNLHGGQAMPGRFTFAGLATLWVADCIVCAVTYAGGGGGEALLLARAIAVLVAAALLAVALLRPAEAAGMRLSRAVTYRSLSALAIGAYLGLIALITSVIGAIGGAHVRIWQTALIIGATTAALTLVSSPWLRAWVKVKLAKHFFHHRYDYRDEWIRFTETLGRPDVQNSLEQRIVKAVADLVDAPAGLLLVPDGDGLGAGPDWNWRDDPPLAGRSIELVAHLSKSRRIIELDAVRAGRADRRDLAAVPGWLTAHDSAWVLVPLPHFDQLVGAILLSRPALARPLDWEDFDLLRIAGQQVASYLAEARAHDALAEARRFEEFNRRFAFILHDIKNLVSQLTLVARNAERHADNPDFRADMVATLRESSDRMTELLARLSQRESVAAGDVRPIDVVAVVEHVAQSKRARHPVACAGEPRAVAAADPVRLEQVLTHLVQNAIEASGPGEPVTLDVGEDDGIVHIDVIDRGCGMAPAFVRDRLFKPFVTEKPGGFGIGAFEARQLTLAMGGRLDVTSREGEGTRFRLTLDAAEISQEMEQAA
ncbi:XrtA/PEP-CTERM system histidine kinase PrsK [Stakelama saccharophila]|uniref:histidine kinase n=1 Tax=Stakelama saccharophila TaxID=3075605 RepID=A0ABZ0BA47_9SPHN|nr:XrtA/PEP-CTERM system histidine kinase PrsK [Stakelama sp. W311]WNO54139.1 PEP-CTERM system histidine kinase PrsK [Stakelama sp. W311]